MRLVVAMVVVSILPHVEFRPNDHREDAFLFTYDSVTLCTVLHKVLHETLHQVLHLVLYLFIAFNIWRPWGIIGRVFSTIFSNRRVPLVT